MLEYGQERTKKSYRIIICLHFQLQVEPVFNDVMTQLHSLYPATCCLFPTSSAHRDSHNSFETSPLPTHTTATYCNTQHQVFIYSFLFFINTSAATNQIMAPYFLSSLTIAIAVLAAFANGAVNIPLGSCANFAVEAGTAITFDGTVTTIATGNVGVSPGTSIGGNAILGTGTFESQSTLSIACASDLEIAYNAASAATPTIYLSLVPSGMTMTADLAGLTLTPGVYTSTSSISISASTVTLDGPVLISGVH